jgi:hypothetical protein
MTGFGRTVRQRIQFTSSHVRPALRFKVWLGLRLRPSSTFGRDEEAFPCRLHRWEPRKQTSTCLSYEKVESPYLTPHEICFATPSEAVDDDSPHGVRPYTFLGSQRGRKAALELELRLRYVPPSVLSTGCAPSPMPCAHAIMH